MRLARKILHDYFRGRGFHSEIRSRISFLGTKAEFDAFLEAVPAAIPRLIGAAPVRSAGCVARRVRRNDLDRVFSGVRRIDPACELEFHFEEQTAVGRFFTCSLR